MPTCRSCGAMIERAATECWHCGVAIVAGEQVAVGAPTLPIAELEELDGANTRARTHSAMVGREIIGQYVIADKLGEGGMGEVYLADQPAIGRQVAIKIVHPQTRERDRDEHVERFRNEAKAAARLESPHIVQIFNWGELDDGTLFMAMEYLAGQTLAELLEDQGFLEPELAVAVAEQVCAALSEAHGAGIVHRDLKPSNIMLIRRGDQPHFAKVLDFGVAKLEGSDITRSGAMFGTPQYMSPEQLRGDLLDGRSDLYSLGVVLYELLAGELPFSSPTAVGFITAHLHDQPPPLPARVPAAVAEVVMMLLAKDADERPADAAAVIAELRAALGGRSPAARRRARRRAAQRSLIAGLVFVSFAALGYGGWRLWEWRVQTEDALARERARGVELQRKIDQTEAAARKVREEARAAVLASRQTSHEVRERREQVQHSVRAASREPETLDPKTRAMLDRTRAQLEADLQAVFDERRVPPSEIADVWANHQGRLAALAAGELDEAELREQLVSLIELYRGSFEPKRRGERLPLDRLEELFLAMPTKTELDAEQRQALLDAIHDEHDGNAELSAADRDYYKRVAVAALVREHGTGSVEPASPAGEPAQPRGEPGSEGTPAARDSAGSQTGGQTGSKGGEDSPVPKPGPLPPADDEELEPKAPSGPLPSLDGM